MRVETAFRAIPNDNHSLLCKAKDTFAKPPVCRGHNDGKRFRHHGLIRELRMQVDGRQKARLRRMRVNPSQCQETFGLLQGDKLFLSVRGRLVMRPRLGRQYARCDVKLVFRQLPTQNSTGLVPFARVVFRELHETRRQVLWEQYLPEAGELCGTVADRGLRWGWIRRFRRSCRRRRRRWLGMAKSRGARVLRRRWAFRVLGWKGALAAEA
mmetsp:Transcript_20300/g.38195  ORF Transcript_20300/g.38195 Transcript_20300/m.38195 type:complete len:211 (-) Transcript_20300:490-1122(-)